MSGAYLGLDLVVPSLFINMFVCLFVFFIKELPALYAAENSNHEPDKDKLGEPSTFSGQQEAQLVSPKGEDPQPQQNLPELYSAVLIKKSKMQRYRFDHLPPLCRQYPFSSPPPFR